MIPSKHKPLPPLPDTPMGQTDHDFAFEQSIPPPLPTSSPYRATPSRSTVLGLLAAQPTDAVCIRENGSDCEPATYGSLADFVRDIGTALEALGVRSEDTVPYIVQDGAMAAVAFMAFSSSCQAAPLSHLSSSRELGEAVEQLGAHHILCSVSMFDTVSLAVEHLPVQVLVLEPTPERFVGAFRFGFVQDDCCSSTNSSVTALGPSSGSSTPPRGKHEDSAGDRVALVLRTSGTTSTPKVCPLRMADIVNNGGMIAQALHLTDADVCINAMPLFHIGGLSASILATIASGGSVLCMRGFKPQAFIEALCDMQSPRPTWYSAVPTIHLALLQHAESILESGGRLDHSLRLIRSGAASLSSDAALRMRKVWGCPIIPSYSMTEQMPIAQVPSDYMLDRPGTVGIPLVDVRIVDEANRELPRGEVGEICIHGPNVLHGYTDNEANTRSYLRVQGSRFFRTGDLGYLDAEGWLFLAGRQKELIKVGGEQVSPHEVEAVLHAHPAVHLAVVFGIHHELLGEVTGAAVVLRPKVSTDSDAVAMDIRRACRDAGLASIKVPRVFIVNEEQIPRGPTRKFLRHKLGAALGLEVLPSPTANDLAATPSKGVVTNEIGNKNTLSDAISGVRFVLAIIVCLNHIGDHAWPAEGNRKEDHGQWSATVTSIRTVGDLAVVLFGLMAGFQLAVATGDKSFSKAKFWESRLVPIHLIYLISCLLCAVNRFMSCRPENFTEYEWGSTEACRGTLLHFSYGGTWWSSLAVMLLCLQAWPVGLFVWQISYYTWFSSAYQFCVFLFPFIHRGLKDKVKRGRKVLYLTSFGLQFSHFLTLVFMEIVYIWAKSNDYLEFANYWVWGGYMFPPFWALRFAIGVFGGLQFLEHRPDRDPLHARRWGIATDLMTFFIIAAYVVMVVLGVDIEYRFSAGLLENRMFAGVTPRLLVPFFSTYIYGLATGRGWTARLLSAKWLVRLSPCSYSIYLLHQPVFEWYSVITTGKWWTRRKPFEWFSPDPIPLDFAETFFVVAATVLFAYFVNKLVDAVLMTKWLAFVRCITGPCRARTAPKAAEGASREDQERRLMELVIVSIEDLAGVRPEAEDALVDLLASLGVVALVSSLRSRRPKLSLKPVELLACETVRDVVDMLMAKAAGDEEAGIEDAAATEVKGKGFAFRAGSLKISIIRV